MITNIIKDAIRVIETCTSRTSEPSKYIDGFRTPRGLELAIEQNRQGIYVRTEPLEQQISGLDISPHRIYAAGKSRNSNLNKKRTPRLVEDNPAWYWHFDNIDDLRKLLSFYVTLGPGMLKPAVA